VDGKRNEHELKVILEVIKTFLFYFSLLFLLPLVLRGKECRMRFLVDELGYDVFLSSFLVRCCARSGNFQLS
jgi:hypothetical protein